MVAAEAMLRYCGGGGGDPCWWPMSQGAGEAGVVLC